MPSFSPFPDSQSSEQPDKKAPCHFLQSQQIEMIDEALCSLGEYGEVRLIVEKGRLRFLMTQKSYDTLKWQPGDLNKS
jgi:hypothetical protein